MAGCREVLRTNSATKAQPEVPRRPTDGVFPDQLAPSEPPETTEHSAMIDQPDGNPQAPVSPGQAHVPSPVAVALPDGRRLEFAGPVAGGEIAAAIGPALAKAAIAIRVDGKPRDLASVVDRDAAVRVITRDTPEGLEILRHDAAHVMAEAVKELYPDAQVTFGPATETGFYYDFARDEPFTPEDLEKIEARMRDIVGRDEKISREVWSRRANKRRLRSSA